MKTPNGHPEDSQAPENDIVGLADEDDSFLDHPDDLLDGTDPLTEEEGELFLLFAEALDPNNPKTLEEAKAEWEQVL